MKEYVENHLNLKVLTPSGYQQFNGIALIGEFCVVKIKFNNRKTLECTHNHKIFDIDNGLVEAKDLTNKNRILTETGGYTRVKSVEFTNKTEKVYDLIDVNGGHLYSTNGIISHNCEFVADDETLIHPLCLNRLTPKVKLPEFYIGTSRWYREPEPNKAYLIALDPSGGTSNDFAAIQLFQIPEMVQVAEWQSNNMPARHQVRVLLEMMVALDGILRDNPRQQGDPEIFWTFENNTIGEGILTIVEDSNEDRFPGQLVTERRRKGLQMKRVRKGLHTSPRSKLSACARIKSLLESDRMTIYSNNLLKELKNFVASGVSFKAKSGEHDDLVSSCLLIVRMLDVVLSWGITPGDGNLREYIDDDELLMEENYQEPMPTM